MPNNKLPFPVWVLVLDFIGSILLALGFADWFAEFGLTPEALRFDNYPMVFVVLGFILMTPSVIWVIKLAMANRPKA